MTFLRSVILILFAVAPLLHGDNNESLSLDPLGAPPLPTAATPAQALDSYLAANREQQDRLRDSSTEVEIQAKLPGLKREALQRAVRRVSPAGEISYDPVGSTGDNMVRKEVIARYMSAEQDASRKVAPGDVKLQPIGITRDNYEFKYKGLGTLNDRKVYVFDLKPKQKRIGLFKGEIWVDVLTFQTLRESGTFVKSPSIYLKKIQFVRQYDIQDGLAVPSRVSSTIEARMVGKRRVV